MSGRKNMKAMAMVVEEAMAGVVEEVMAGVVEETMAVWWRKPWRGWWRRPWRWCFRLLLHYFCNGSDTAASGRVTKGTVTAGSLL
jgi:hypothetical protein